MRERTADELVFVDAPEPEGAERLVRIGHLGVEREAETREAALRGLPLRRTELGEQRGLDRLLRLSMQGRGAPGIAEDRERQSLSLGRGKVEHASMDRRDRLRFGGANVREEFAERAGEREPTLFLVSAHPSFSKEARAASSSSCVSIQVSFATSSSACARVISPVSSERWFASS